MSNLIIKVVDYFQEKAHIHSIRGTVFQQEQRIAPDVDFDGLDETATQIVAYLEGVAVGTARVRYLNPQTAKIERLAVLPVFRGRGIGLKIKTGCTSSFQRSRNWPENKDWLYFQFSEVEELA